MTETGSAVYVYGVMPTPSRAIASRGIQGADVAIVEHGALAALTSPLDGTTLAARDLRAHWRVLEEAFEHGVVLPVRFGTVLKSEEAVRQQLLEPNAQHLTDLMEQMAGMVQLNVSGRYEEDALLREIVLQNPQVARLRERNRSRGDQAPAGDQLALGRMVEREIARRRAADGAIVRDTLGPLASAVREEEVAHPSAFNVAFLVHRDGIDDFGRAVAELRTGLGDRVELRYAGPLPPFSFADADLAIGAGAWG